ncbi:hypothetical protein IAT38_003337 [Cryptococcus sp. DSM 104549]
MGASEKKEDTALGSSPPRSSSFVVKSRPTKKDKGTTIPSHLGSSPPRLPDFVKTGETPYTYTTIPPPSKPWSPPVRVNHPPDIPLPTPTPSPTPTPRPTTPSPPTPATEVPAPDSPSKSRVHLPTVPPAVLAVADTFIDDWLPIIIILTLLIIFFGTEFTLGLLTIGPLLLAFIFVLFAELSIDAAAGIVILGVAPWVVALLVRDERWWEAGVVVVIGVLLVQHRSPVIPSMEMLMEGEKKEGGEVVEKA